MTLYLPSKAFLRIFITFLWQYHFTLSSCAKCIFIGMEPVAVLNSLEKVKETLVEKQNDFAGRPVTHSSELLF